jgi:hypothetical protein
MIQSNTTITPVTPRPVTPESAGDDTAVVDASRITVKSTSSATATDVKTDFWRRQNMRYFLGHSPRESVSSPTRSHRPNSPHSPL